MMVMAATMSSSAVPPAVRSIPGSYGLPVLGPLKDRLDYFWFQGPDTFFRSRMATYKSTVFRTNMPPTFPFFLNVDPRVVALVDCTSFPALFDPALVNKADVLIGDYRPSLSFTGDTRVVVYQDTNEPSHERGKAFYLELLKRGSKILVAEFLKEAEILTSAIEKGVKESGKAGLFLPLQQCIFAFLCKGLLGADPAKASSPEIKNYGFAMLDKWLALQLLPITPANPLPQPLTEIFLHSFPFPFFLASADYNKLVDFVRECGRDAINLAVEQYGIKEDEAIHSILFVLGFNAFGGFTVFLPSLLTTIGREKTGLQQRLREEVCRVLETKDLGFEAVAEMDLVRSTVYEALRLNPPVPTQFGRARKDFVLTSHDASFQVTKGELLCGYQPLAMRDPQVFDDPESFIPDRFTGAEGKDLLRYLFWSNGPETGRPAVGNKQCAAKDYVVNTACLLLAHIFKNYDTFQCADDSADVIKIERATNPGTPTTSLPNAATTRNA